jgi:alanine racemase
MSQRYLSWTEIDLDAVAFDIRGFKRYVGDKVLLGTVVKANAYGHGAVEMARACLQNGADWAIVNRSNEGVELRQGGITAPTLMLGYLLAEEAERIVEWDLRPTVTNMAQVEALSAAAARRGTRVPVHVKLDTGLSRQGVMPADALDFVRAVSRIPNVVVEGLYSHFAVADENSPESEAFTRRQFETFVTVRDELKRAGFEIPICHIANTAATLNDPSMHLDLVRVGSGIGGLYPSDETKRTVPLKPALSLKSHVGRVTVLPPGASVSYGRTYVTSAPTTIALVPVGYGDGYRRSLSNRGVVLIRGRRAPVVGRVSMDQCMVDVTHIPDVAMNDEVVLIGAQGTEYLSADEVAELGGTVAAELTTALAARLPRVYLQGGQVVAVRDLVDDTKADAVPDLR